MLTITCSCTCTCDDPHCPGTVEFGAEKHRSKSGRLTGRCDRCHSLHSLYGGQVRLEPPARVAANGRAGP